MGSQTGNRTRKPRPKRIRLIVQAVVEVPMSRRQALLASYSLPRYPALADLKKAEVCGHSILRGLTFLELILTVVEETDLKLLVANSLMLFTVTAESHARRGESDEFALKFAEMFRYGRPHEPEMVLLPSHYQSIGIGGTDETEDTKWAQLLSGYYNPPTRRVGEVKSKRTELIDLDVE